MPRQTALATVSGLIAGAATAAALSEDLREDPVGNLLLPFLAQIGPMVCITLVAMKVIHVWLHHHTSATRGMVHDAAEQRAAFRRETDRRLDDIARREDALDQATAANEHRIAAAHRALERERAAHQALQTDYQELVDDYNAVVVNSLQQGADTFRPRPTADPSEGGGGVIVRMPVPGRPAHDRAVTHPAHGATPPYP